MPAAMTLHHAAHIGVGDVPRERKLEIQGRIRIRVENRDGDGEEDVKIAARERDGFQRGPFPGQPPDFGFKVRHLAPAGRHGHGRSLAFPLRCYQFRPR